LRIKLQRRAGVNVTVAGRWMVGGDAEGDDFTRMGRRVGLRAKLGEALSVLKYMVGGEDGDDRRGVSFAAAQAAATPTAAALSRRSGSSRIVASAPISRNCSATRNRYSIFVMTSAGSNMAGSLTKLTTD
jgi:hypothetical protein